MRTLLATVFGVASALLIVAGAEWAETALYPLPTIDIADADALARVVTDLPFPAKVLIVSGWLIGAAGGVWLGLRICDRRVVAWIVVAPVVATVIAAGLANALTLPHPLWMKVCAVVLPVIGGMLAMRAHRRPHAGEALLG